MFNFLSSLVLICFLLPISVSAGRQMSYQVPQKVKRQSKRNFSITGFSQPLLDSAAHRWDFCSGCALTQGCHSSIWQRRKECWGRFEPGPSSWVSCLPQESTKDCSRLQCLSLQNNAVAWRKPRYPQRQGEVLVCLLNSPGKEATAREMRESYRREDLCCCAEMPDPFLMETLFFMGTESPGLLIVQRVCAFSRRILEISCARRTPSPAVPPAFLLPQLTIPKLPVCHLG